MSPDDPHAPDPFDAFETTSEILAFVYKHEGAKGLRELFAMLPDRTPPLFSRECLQEEAADLRYMRLPKVAAVVEEFADRFPSELDPDVFCTWTEKPDTPAMVEHWRWYVRRRIEQRRKRRGLLIA
jgi:hypothetical protein